MGHIKEVPGVLVDCACVFEKETDRDRESVSATVVD